MAFALGRLAAECGDLLGVFARANEIEAEIGLKALLLKIQQNKLQPIRCVSVVPMTA